MAYPVQYSGASEQHFPNSSESEVEVIVQDLFRLDPERAREIITGHTEVEVVRSVLDRINRDTDHSDEAKGNIFEGLAFVLSFQSALQLEMEEETENFLNTLLLIEIKETRQNILDRLISLTRDQPYQKLTQSLKLILDHPTLDIGRKTEKVTKFFDSFADYHRDQYFDHYFTESDPENLGILCALIEDDAIAHDLAARFMAKYEGNDDFHEDCRMLLKYYTKITDQSENKRCIFLERWLSVRDDHTWIEENFFEFIDDLNIKAISYLIQFLDSESRKSIPLIIDDQETFELFDGIITKIFHRVDCQEKRIAILTDLFGDLEPEVWENFFPLLQRYPSIISPYIFLVLDNMAFTNFYRSTYASFAAIARHLGGLSPNQICDLAKRVHESPRGERLLQSAYLDIAPQEWSPFPRNYTMKTMYELIHGMLVGENPQQALEDYQEDLHRIPEFLLAVAVQQEEYRNTTIQMMRYLSDSQIEAIASSLPQEGLVEQLDMLSHTILANQFVRLLTTLSPENLVFYTENKIAELEEISEKLKNKYEFSEKQLLFLESHKETIDSSNYSQMFEEANEAYRQHTRAAQELQFPIWRIALHFLDPLEQAAPAIAVLRLKIQRSLDSIEEYKARRREPGGILELLENLEIDSDKEEEEAPSLISNEYWSLLVTSYLCHYQINHVGEILDRGIQSDRDFQLLGLSHQNRTVVDRICQTINEFSEQTTEKQVTLARKWEELLLSAVADSTHLYEIKKQLLAMFSFEFDEALFAKLHLILASISTLDFISEDHRAKALQLIAQGTRADSLPNQFRFCKATLKFGMDFVIANHFHVKLKRYLTQPHSEAIWEYLRLLKVSSLEQLRTAELINSQEQCYDLLSIAMQLGFQPWEGEENSDDSARSSSDADETAEVDLDFPVVPPSSQESNSGYGSDDES